jgi:hypothetical protein
MQIFELTETKKCVVLWNEVNFLWEHVFYFKGRLALDSKSDQKGMLSGIPIRPTVDQQTNTMTHFSLIKYSGINSSRILTS